MVHALLYSDFEQVKFGMLPMQYLHGDDNGPGPVALGTTGESTHKQNICSPVWNGPMTSTVEAGPQAQPYAMVSVSYDRYDIQSFLTRRVHIM